jgi:UDP-N-acetylglucosamine:LPS N-acetylglucosamine transferase
MIIEDHEFDVAMLKQVIGELISNPQRLAAMRDHYNNAFLHSRNDLLVDETLSLCNFVRK